MKSSGIGCQVFEKCYEVFWWCCDCVLDAKNGALVLEGGPAFDGPVDGQLQDASGMCRLPGPMVARPYGNPSVA